jgi:hypothetical protein
VSESPIGGRSALLVQQIETAEQIGPRGGVMKYARLLPAACNLRNPKQKRQEARGAKPGSAEATILCTFFLQSRVHPVRSSESTGHEQQG